MESRREEILQSNGVSERGNSQHCAMWVQSMGGVHLCACDHSMTRASSLVAFRSIVEIRLCFAHRTSSVSGPLDKGGFGRIESSRRLNSTGS
jgi:hypothetical protein